MLVAGFLILRMRQVLTFTICNYSFFSFSVLGGSGAVQNSL